MTQVTVQKQPQQNLIQLKSILNSDSTKKRFNEMLGTKAVGFISSVLNVVNQNKTLQKAEPQSILMSAAIAATLDLPVNPNLGFAAIVPYGTQAQFQIMWRGLVQLAQRSGQYRTINTTEVYEGEIKKHNRFTGEIEFDEEGRKSDKVIGYVAYFSLINGFEKYFYMTREECESHAKKYSQTYKSGYGKWKDDFDAMARKTVLKLLLSRYGILSIDMQNAIRFDQSIVKGDVDNIEDAEPEYIDSEQVQIETKTLTEEDRVAIYEQVKSDPTKAAEAYARGEITAEQFGAIKAKSDPTLNFNTDETENE